MSRRGRFVSIWNSAATIVFFAGIFLGSGFSVFGFSGVIVGIFMWIIGGAVASILYGPDPEKENVREIRQAAGPTVRTTSSNQMAMGQTTPGKKTCVSCGSLVDADAVFCPECGVSLPAK